jgi:hypothetical protein
MSFPVICFCKHICAVQNHFPEECKPVPTSMLAIHCADSFAADPQETDSNSNGDDKSDEDECILPSPTTMINKLSKLTIRLQAHPPTALPDYLQDFYKHLDCIVDELEHSDQPILPWKKKVAPNQHSWTETVVVMNVRVKSKRKAHTNPYAGREQPGKKAKPDAQSSENSAPAPTLSNCTTIPALSNPSAPPAPSQILPWTQPMVPIVQPLISLPLSLPQISTLASSSYLQIPPTPIPQWLLKPGSSTVSSIPPQTLLTPEFRPEMFSLDNLPALNALKRVHLNQLCAFHSLKANRRNKEITL